MADDWSSFKPEPAPEGQDWSAFKPQDQDWSAFNPEPEQKSWWERGKVRPTTLTMDSSLRTAPYVKEVIGAFGEGFQEGYGEHLDFTKGLIKEAGKPGPYRLFGKEGEGHNPFEAMNEILAHAIVGTAETALRIGGGLFRGAQSAVFEATGSRDLAAIPEAFFGTPHPFGIKPPSPLERVSAGTHIAGALLKEEGVTIAEIRGGPGIDAYHGSPHDFERFDISKIGTGEGAQSYGHGLYFAENLEVAKNYADSLGIKNVGSAGEDSAALALRAAAGDRDKAIAQLEDIAGRRPGPTSERAAEGAKLLREGWAPPGTTYQVRILADREHFLDWDKPLSEQSPKVRDALLAAHPELTPEMTGQRVYEALGQKMADVEPGSAAYAIGAGKSEASAALREAGIPGIKYLDQGSRVPKENPDIRALEIARRAAQSDLRAAESKGDSVNAQRIRRGIADIDAKIAELPTPEQPLQTSNFVVFDDKSVQITHKNGEPLTKAERADLVGGRPQGPSVPDFIQRMREADSAKEYLKSAEIAKEALSEEFPGVQMMGSSGGFKIPIEVNGEVVGHHEITIDPQKNALKSGFIFIETEYHGKGIGIAWYRKIVDWTTSNGMEFHSDSSVSAQAAMMYDALDRRGYNVESNLQSDIAHTGAVSTLDGKPAFVIKPREPQKPIDMDQARDLGVVGPERPSINEGTAKEAAEAATKSAAEVGKLEEKPPSLPDDGWQARFDQFVGKLQAPKDVKKLIRAAASENENFPAARQGSIPLQHVEDIAAAAGVEPGEVNVRGLGRTLRNDQEVRVAMRLMMQGTDNVKILAKEVVADASEQNLIKFQEAILRRDMAVEQIVGLRAEWGRTGNVFQEFMREVKDSETLDAFLKDKCPL